MSPGDRSVNSVTARAPSAGRFLIVTWDGGGNTPSAFNLGARLVKEGHEVRLVGWESMEERAATAGVEFATYPSVPPWPPDPDLDALWEERVQPALISPAVRDDVIAAAKDFGPDVVVVDCMLDAGLEAARVLSVPTVVLVHVMYSMFMHHWGDEPTVAERARVFDAADVVLALIPPEFDEPCPVPANTTYVGPITAPWTASPLAPDDARLLAEPGDPWILLSLGTTVQRQVDALPPVLDAVASLPVRVLLTLGGVVPTTAVDCPSNVTVRDFLPHELVLPHMSAVIAHGGLSTITAALAAGVPLLCIPQGREQPINAERVVACGVGRVVATDASAPEIADALEALLADRAAQRKARHFAHVIAQLGGSALATEKVVALLPSTTASHPQA